MGTSWLRLLGHDALVLFAMVNVVGNLPIFADLTQGMDRATRNATFRTAVTVAGGIVLAFAVLGNLMLQRVFQVGTAAFKVAGGILVFAVAARALLGGSARPSVKRDDVAGGPAAFPMGFPYLAGPGTIVTTILLMQRSGAAITSAAAVLVYVAALPTLHLSPVLHKAIGRVGVLVVARILQIFIAAKAADFALSGLREYLQL
ncbi:MAG: MarC family protein [Gemmatimonadetes bacterium]|nr:MarC family protein [Gemmatimonadota bacterium]